MSEEVSVLRDKVSGLEAELRTVLIDRAVRTAAESARAVHPGQVSLLFQADVGLEVDDERRVFLTGPDGAPLLDDQGRPASLDRAVAVWLDENPHLVRPAGRSGSGTPAETVRDEPSFTPDQLADPGFYRANRDRIHQFFNRR